MFNINDYFNSGSVYPSYSFLQIIFFFMSLMLIISLVILVKTYLSLKKINNESNKYLLRTMLGILFWNLGEWITGLTQLLTNQQWGIFSGIDNIFLAIGLVLTINSFFNYMQGILKVNKYKQRRKLINQKVFSLLKFFTFSALYLFTIRFLARPFMSVEGKNESENLIIGILIALSFFVLILMVILFIQLLSEKKVLSSKLDKIRINFFFIFLLLLLLALINVWIFLLSYLISGLENISNIVLFLIYLPSVIGLIFLYYGIFLPIWLQKRLGLLPSF